MRSLRQRKFRADPCLDRRRRLPHPNRTGMLPSRANRPPMPAPRFDHRGPRTAVLSGRGKPNVKQAAGPDVDDRRRKPPVSQHNRLYRTAGITRRGSFLTRVPQI
jgi:hypothetical protein